MIKPDGTHEIRTARRQAIWAAMCSRQNENSTDTQREELKGWSMATGETKEEAIWNLASWYDLTEDPKFVEHFNVFAMELTPGVLMTINQNYIGDQDDEPIHEIK